MSETAANQNAGGPNSTGGRKKRGGGGKKKAPSSPAKPKIAEGRRDSSNGFPSLGASGKVDGKGGGAKTDGKKTTKRRQQTPKRKNKGGKAKPAEAADKVPPSSGEAGSGESYKALTIEPVEDTFAPPANVQAPSPAGDATAGKKKKKKKKLSPRKVPSPPPEPDTGLYRALSIHDAMDMLAPPPDYSGDQDTADTSVAGMPSPPASPPVVVRDKDGVAALNKLAMGKSLPTRLKRVVEQRKLERVATEDDDFLKLIEQEEQEEHERQRMERKQQAALAAKRKEEEARAAREAEEEESARRTKAQVDEQARRAAEEEARAAAARAAEEERVRKAQADEQARRKAEEEARAAAARAAEEERTRKAQADEQTRRKAEEEARAATVRAAEEERARANVIPRADTAEKDTVRTDQSKPTKKVENKGDVRAVNAAGRADRAAKKSGGGGKANEASASMLSIYAGVGLAVVVIGAFILMKRK